MAGCNPLAFNLEACAWSLVDAAGAALPWPVWVLLLLILIGAVWHFAGWPGLLGLVGLGSFLLGRRSVVETDEIWPPPDRGGRRPAQQHRPTILDWWRRK